MKTMAYTLHVTKQNSFYDLHNGHVDFELWLGQVDLRIHVHCAL